MTAGKLALADFFGRLRALAGLCRLTRFDTSHEEGRSKERYRRVILSSVTGAAAKGVGVLTGLVSVPLALRYLGTERYGIWMTVTSLVTMLTFADLGLGNGLINAISEADGKGDRDSGRVAVSSAFYLLLGVASLLLLVLAIVHPLLPWPRLFNVTSDVAAREASITAAVLITITLVNVPLSVVQKVQMGCQEGFQVSLWTAFGGVLGFAGLILAVLFKASLPVLVLGVLGAPLLATAGNWLQFFWKKRPWLAPSRSLVSWVVARRLATTGVAFVVLQVFAVLGSGTDNIVIAQYLGARSVAVYAVTQKLFSVTLLAQFVALPLWPAFGEAQARGDKRWARRALNRSLAATLALGGVTAIPLLLFGRTIVRLWAGSAVVPSASLLLGFAFWVVLGSYGGTISAFLNAGPLLTKQIPFFGLASLAALGLKILFVPWWGAAGAVWGTVFAYGVLYAGPAAFLAYRSLREPEGIEMARAD